MVAASYTKSLASARSLLSSSRYPPELLQLIESDIERTLPKLKLFQKDIGPLWEDLRDLLLAYSVFWRERPGYVSPLTISRSHFIRGSLKGAGCLVVGREQLSGGNAVDIHACSRCVFISRQPHEQELSQVVLCQRKR